ncbi:MAG TPA: hypothetical protein VJ747_03755 [Stellaceae bacterium]|jgi:hypothetical protein|nr:hypothetical protein [Stellaceae bacterium]
MSTSTSERPSLYDLAERCREMAARARKAQQRSYLLALAESYEQEAAELERRSPVA